MSFQHTVEIHPAPQFSNCIIVSCNKLLGRYEKRNRMVLCTACKKDVLKENKLTPHARYKNLLSKNTWNRILHQVQNNKGRNSDSFNVLQTKKFLPSDRCGIADSSSANIKREICFKNLN